MKTGRHTVSAIEERQRRVALLVADAVAHAGGIALQNCEHVGGVAVGSVVPAGRAETACVAPAVVLEVIETAGCSAWV